MRVLVYLLYLLFTILIVIFATQNMEPVDIYLIIGSPVKLPLIVIVGLSFFIGYAFALLNVVLRATMRSNAKKRARSGN